MMETTTLAASEIDLRLHGYNGGMYLSEEERKQLGLALLEHPDRNWRHLITLASPTLGWDIFHAAVAKLIDDPETSPDYLVELVQGYNFQTSEEEAMKALDTLRRRYVADKFCDVNEHHLRRAGNTMHHRHQDVMFRAWKICHELGLD
jgi:hypothetical protein